MDAAIVARDTTLPIAGRPLGAYEAAPAGGAHPGLLVIHEAFGLTEHIKDVTRRLAREGYHALAVDLFSEGNRALCMARVFAGIYVRPLANGTVARLRAAIDLLRRTEGVQASRVGVIGFCMGGSYALQLACVEGEIRASATFYGSVPRPIEAFRRSCPIVGSFPEKDFTASGARRLDAALDAYGVEHEIEIYPDTRHGFFNDTRRVYDADAAADAWARTLAFFARELR